MSLKKEWYLVTEAAEILGKTRNAVHKQMGQKRLNGVKGRDGRIRFSRVELEHYITSR